MLGKQLHDSNLVKQWFTGDGRPARLKASKMSAILRMNKVNFIKFSFVLPLFYSVLQSCVTADCVYQPYDLRYRLIKNVLL